MGDTASLFRIHDINAQKEAYEKAFQLNCITYDHNSQFLAQIKNEAIYAFNLLVLSSPKTDPVIEITSLEDLPFDYDLLLDLNRKVKFNNEEISYGIALLNKFAGLHDIKINSRNTGQDLSRFIYGVSTSNEDYHSRLSEFNRKLNWVLSCHRTQPLTFELEESCTILNQCLNNDVLKQLPDNPYIGNYIYHSIVDKVVENIPKDYKLTKLLKAKFKKQQFSRSVISIGYVASEKNEVYKTPISSTLLGGLSEDDFFISSIGTRKGLVDKQSLTPKSGYLCRSLVMNLSPLEIDEEDCGTTYGFKITILNKRHSRMFVHRYYKIDFNDPWELVTEKTVLKTGKEYIFRSPITCQTPNYKLCKKCFGEYEVANKRYVGIHTAQVVSEKLTQLSMRSFHTSGSMTLPINKELKQYIQDHLISVDRHEQDTTLHFDTNVDAAEIVDLFKQIPGFMEIDCNRVSYNNDIGIIENQDIGSIINDVNKCLQTETRNIIPISDTYEKLITNILSVGDLYSSFIELILSILYVGYDNEIIRYQIKKGLTIKISKKYSVKEAHNFLSPVLSLLYEPNTNSIRRYYDNLIQQNKHVISVYEKIWLDLI